MSVRLEKLGAFCLPEVNMKQIFSSVSPAIVSFNILSVFVKSNI
jgi:hypothetical protein